MKSDNKLANQKSKNIKSAVFASALLLFSGLAPIPVNEGNNLAQAAENDLVTFDNQEIKKMFLNEYAINSGKKKKSLVVKDMGQINEIVNWQGEYNITKYDKTFENAIRKGYSLSSYVVSESENTKNKLGAFDGILKFPLSYICIDDASKAYLSNEENIYYHKYMSYLLDPYNSNLEITDSYINKKWSKKPIAFEKPEDKKLVEESLHKKNPTKDDFININELTITKTGQYESIKRLQNVKDIISIDLSNSNYKVATLLKKGDINDYKTIVVNPIQWLEFKLDGGDVNKLAKKCVKVRYDIEEFGSFRFDIAEINYMDQERDKDILKLSKELMKKDSSALTQILLAYTTAGNEAYYYKKLTDSSVEMLNLPKARKDEVYTKIDNSIVNILSDKLDLLGIKYDKVKDKENMYINIVDGDNKYSILITDPDNMAFDYITQENVEQIDTINKLSQSYNTIQNCKSKLKIDLKDYKEAFRDFVVDRWDYYRKLGYKLEFLPNLDEMYNKYSYDKNLGIEITMPKCMDGLKFTSINSNLNVEAVTTMKVATTTISDDTEILIPLEAETHLEIKTEEQGKKTTESMIDDSLVRVDIDVPKNNEFLI